MFTENLNNEHHYMQILKEADVAMRQIANSFRPEKATDYNKICALRNAAFAELIKLNVPFTDIVDKIRITIDNEYYDLSKDNLKKFIGEEQFNLLMSTRAQNAVTMEEVEIGSHTYFPSFNAAGQLPAQMYPQNLPFHPSNPGIPQSAMHLLPQSGIGQDGYYPMPQSSPYINQYGQMINGQQMGYPIPMPAPSTTSAPQVNSDMENRLKELEATLARIEEKTEPKIVEVIKDESLKEELQIAKESAYRANLDRDRALQEKDEMLTDLSKMQEELSNTQEALAETEVQRADALKSMQEAASIIEITKKEKERLAAEHQKALSDLAATEADKNQALKIVDEITEQKIAITAKYNEMTEAHNKIIKENEEIVSAHEIMIKAQDTLKEQLKTVEEEKQQLVNDARRLTEEKNNVEEQIAQLSKEHEAELSAKKALANEIASLEERLKLASNANETEDILLLTQKLEEAQAEIQNSKAEEERLIKELQELQSETEAIRAEADSTKEQNIKLEQISERLDEEATALRAEKDKIKAYAFQDAVSGNKNQLALEDEINDYNFSLMSLTCINILHLVELQKEYGQELTDAVVKSVSNKIKNIFLSIPHISELYHISYDKFLYISQETPEALNLACEQLSSLLDDERIYINYYSSSSERYANFTELYNHVNNHINNSVETVVQQEDTSRAQLVYQSNNADNYEEINLTAEDSDYITNNHTYDDEIITKHSENTEQTILDYENTCKEDVVDVNKQKQVFISGYITPLSVEDSNENDEVNYELLQEDSNVVEEKMETFTSDHFAPMTITNFDEDDEIDYESLQEDFD